MADDDTSPCTFQIPPLILHSLDRFQYLATVNTPPDSCESDDLRSIISDSENSLSEYRDMLFRAKNTVEALEKRIIEVGSVLQTVKAIAHPIRSIPSEILSMIFAQCVGAHLSESRYKKDSLSTECAPWYLSYVCQRWRNLVLSSPSLWSSLSFSFPLYKDKPHRQVLYLATLHLERSSRLPLSVELIADETPQFCNHPLSFVIEATTMRWETVVFDCLLPILRFFAGYPFPLLETVITGYQFFDDDEERGTQITTLFSLPKLSRLIAATDDLFYMVQMPWTRLVFYQSDFHAFQEKHFKALRQMTSLRSLTVTLDNEGAISAPDIVILPRLKDLQICIEDSAALTVIDGFMASLSMPSLQQLHLDYDRSITLPVFPSVHPDFCHVNSLHVCGNLMKGDSQFIAFLSIMGGVEKLQISWGLMTEKLLRQFAPLTPGIDAPLLPRLRILDVHRSWLFHPPAPPSIATDKVFNDIALWLASRKVGVQTFRKSRD